MGLSLCLTSQSKGAIGELFEEGFRLLVLFKATKRWLVSPDHTSRQEAGVLATEAASLFHVATLLPFVLKKQVNIAHPCGNRAEGLDILLEPTTASNNE